MTANYKVNGVWKQATPYVNVGGTWKIAKSAWTNLSSEWKSWFLQGGLNDGGFATYNVYNGFFNNNVFKIVIQSDNKILIGGDFTIYNGAKASALIRLNSDGTIDTAFTTNLGSSFNDGVYGIATQSDGKIIVSGLFTTFNGVTVNRIVRLNSDGTRDATFTTNTGSSFNNQVNAIAIQSDGKIVVGGLFTTFNGTAVNRIMRLNSDGTQDTAFTINIGTGASGAVNAIALQSDGKIIIGGAFTTFNGVTVNYIVRLNSDGTRDTGFTTNTGTGANSSISSIAIQTDGKIIIGGSFPSFNGVAVNRIVRLNSDGTRDTAFTTNTGTGASSSSNITAIATQSDGKIILVGTFTTFNGVTVNRVVRLNSDGTRDTGFTTNTGTGANTNVNTVAIQSDGRIFLGGSFLTFNGVTVNDIVRLNTDGTRDWNVVSGLSGSVYAVAIQPDNKIIAGGAFATFYSPSSSIVTVNRIIRFNLDGTQDATFTTNTGSSFNNQVNAIAIQSDGKIVVGGLFTTFNGTAVNRIMRLNSDGTQDTAFTINIGTGASGAVNAIALQSDGKIVLGGLFTTFNGVTVNNFVRLNSDGTRDTAFTTNTGTGASGDITAIALQTDGKIVAGGAFLTFNGVTVNRIVRLNSDGTRDTAFTTNTGSGFQNYVYAVALQTDGKIVAGGSFTTFNGVTVNRIVRLNSDGTRDTGFTTNTGTGGLSEARAVVIQSDNKIVVGGAFLAFNGVTVNRVVRLNSDGTIDTAFTTNAGTGSNNTVFAVAIQSDSKIILGGSFSGFNQINRSRLVRVGGDIAQ